MGDNGRRARAYPRLEKGVGVSVPAGVRVWSHGHDGSWKRADLEPAVHGTVLRLVGASSGGRPALVVVALDGGGGERGFARDDVVADGFGGTGDT